MTEPSSWPPPPNVTPPLAAHDEFLSACVRSSTPKQTLSRLRLVSDLRQETGQDLRSCLAVVNNFCDRHTILMPLSGFWTWGAGCLLPLFNLAVALIMGVVVFVMIQRHDAAVTRLARTAIVAEATNMTYMFLSVIAVTTSSIIVTILWRIKKQRRQAEEARAKFA